MLKQRFDLLEQTMETFSLTIGHEPDAQTFEVKDYAHDIDDERHGCKFEVFRDGAFVLSLQPDDAFLRTCADPGILDDAIIHQIIAKIEAQHL